MRRLEVELNVAKGKVLECEEGMKHLQKEVEEADENLGEIENGIANLQRGLVLHANLEQRDPYPNDSESIGSASL
jgi:hypothetical protein